MLDVCCVPTSYDEHTGMVKTGDECQVSAYMLLCKFAFVVCCVEVLIHPSFFLSLTRCL